MGDRELTDIFKILEKEGKTDIDNLVKWMKDSKLIAVTKTEEAKAIEMFTDVRDHNHVNLDEFKGILKQLAKEKKRSLEELSKQLADDGPDLMRAATEGIGAFKDALQRK